MSSEEQKPWLDLGPFFPKKETTVIPPRTDGAAVAGPAGLAEGDMNTGSSQGGSNSKLRDVILPAVSYDEKGAPNARKGADHDR